MKLWSSWLFKSLTVLPVIEEQYDSTVSELVFTNLGGTAEV